MLVYLFFFLCLTYSQDFNFTILHTGDVKGQVLPVGDYNTGCSLNDALADNGTHCYGGLARFKTYVNRVRAQTSDVILVDAGNFYFGSLYSIEYRGEKNRDYFNDIGYDASTLGVQDFWQGPDPLKLFLNGLQLDPQIGLVVSSNMYVPPTSTLAGFTKPWAVTTKNGRKIGIVAAITVLLQQHSNSGDSVVVANNTVDAVHIAVTQLETAHPDCKIIIFLSATDDESIDALIARTVFGVDVIVQSNLNPPRLNEKYPQVVWNGLQQPVLIVSSGTMGSYIGHLNVLFDQDGIVKNWTGNSIFLTSPTYPPEDNLWTRIQLDYPAVESLKNQIVGSATAPIWGGRGDDSGTPGCGYSDCPLGQLLTRAEMALCTDCDFAVQNAGGMEGSILPQNGEQGVFNVTYGALLDAFPFQNTMATFFLKGSDVVLALENAVDYSKGNGAFLQATGIRYAFNPGNLSASSDGSVHRIVNVEIQNRGTQQWEPVNTQRFYKLAANSWMRSGGDGFSVFSDFGFNFFDYLPTLDQVVAKYLLANSPNYIIPQSELNVCYDVLPTLTVNITTKAVVWPNNCTTLRTDSTQDLLSQCATSRDLCMSLAGERLFDSFSINTSQCGACSGLGSCYNLVCTCTVPTSGPFEGKEVIRGSDCSDVQSEIKISDAARYGMTALSALTILCAMFCSAGYLYYQDMKVIKRSSPLFCHLLSVGGMLGAIGVIISLQNASDFACNAQVCFFGLGFVLLFGSLFAKTYRIYKIFVVSEIFVRHVKNADVLRIVAICVGVEAAILCVFLIPYPLTRYGFQIEGKWEYSFGCSSNNQDLLLAILFAFNGALLLWGVFLALRTRHLEKQINESRMIAMSIYNMTIALIVIVPVVVRLSRLDVTTAAILQAVLVDYIIVFTLLCVFLPKWFAILRGEGNKELDMFAAHYYSRNSSPGMESKSNLEAESTFSDDDVIVAGIEDLEGLSVPVQLARIKGRLKKAQDLVEFLQRRLAQLEGTVDGRELSKKSEIHDVELRSPSSLEETSMLEPEKEKLAADPSSVNAKAEDEAHP